MSGLSLLPWGTWECELSLVFRVEVREWDSLMTIEGRLTRREVKFPPLGGSRNVQKKSQTLTAHQTGTEHREMAERDPRAVFGGKVEKVWDHAGLKGEISVTGRGLVMLTSTRL